MKRKLVTIIIVLGLLGGVSSFAQEKTEAPKLALHNNTPDNNWAPYVVQPGRLGADQIDPSVKIRIYARVCHAIEAPHLVWDNDVVAVQSYWDGTVPVLDNVLTLGSWRYLCVDTSGTFPMWLGVAMPGSDRGDGISFPIDIQSPNAPFALSNDVEVVITSNDGNSLGYMPVFSRYYPEIQGIQSGVVITSGASTMQVNEIRYVGSRASYVAHDQPGINIVSNYVTGLSGFIISCEVTLKRSGTVVGRAKLDVPFSPTGQSLVITPTELKVAGVANQQYTLLESSVVAPADWQIYGDPVFSGTSVSLSPTEAMKFFKAVQTGP